MLPSVMERIFEVLGGTEYSNDKLYSAYRRSFFISADMAHGIHPNYPAKHQQNHQVKTNQGVVIKINANNRYATNAISSAITRVVAEKSKVPIQPFIVRADSRCGSTIGPMLSSLIGVTAVDVGCSMFAMHSIRESCGVLDAHYYTEFFNGFYKNDIPEVNKDFN
jgi:aspartyl aminopeptidase